MRSAETELQNTIEIRAMASEIAAPKPVSTPKRQKDDFEALFKRNFKRKIISPKIEKICWQFTFAALMQPFSNTIYDLQLQKTIVLRMQPLHQATLTQPLQCHLQRLSCKTQKKYAQWRRKLQLHNRIAGWSHFTRKNTRFRAPASSPKQSPCNIHAAITMCFTAWRG